MKRAVNILLILLITLSTYAQRRSVQDSLPTSLHLFYEIDFSGAIRLYKQMILFDPYNPENYYKLGIAYLHTKGKADSALYFFNKTLELYKPKYRKTINKYALSFYRAYAYYLEDMLDSSARLVQNLQTYDKKLPADFINAVNQLYDSLLNKVSDYIRITNLGHAINSQYTEHSPIFVKATNQLIFTSRRKANEYSIKYEDGQYDENIYTAYYNPLLNTWSKVQLIPQIDTNYNIASCSYNPKNQIVIIYKDEGNGSLYYCKLINGQFTVLHKFPKPINTGYAETHGTITSDGKVIYFASDRPGGYGGMDIWMSVLQKDGTWSKPINLGPNINTAGDEDAPYITPDGQYLYFSSTGHNSLGGYDIFVSEKDEFGAWSKPKNLGFPVNTIYNDIFFYPVDSVTAFFASDRNGSLGHGDIYKVEYLQKAVKYQINICYIKGFENTKNLTVQISDSITGEVFIAKPNKDGKFIFVTQPFHKYKVIIQNAEGQTLHEDTIINNTDKVKIEREIILTR